MNTDASVYTFGFGRDHDPDMLKAISDAANGMYYFIENEEQVCPVDTSKNSLPKAYNKIRSFHQRPFAKN